MGKSEDEMLAALWDTKPTEDTALTETELADIAVAQSAYPTEQAQRERVAIVDAALCRAFGASVAPMRTRYGNPYHWEWNKSDHEEHHGILNVTAGMNGLAVVVEVQGKEHLRRFAAWTDPDLPQWLDATLAEALGVWNGLPWCYTCYRHVPG